MHKEIVVRKQRRIIGISPVEIQGIIGPYRASGFLS
jgi:hypothetical protein